jgi:hypothetical protein
MKNCLFVFRVAVLTPITLSVCNAQPTPPNYQLVTTIKLPGGLAGFDISWIDPVNQRYYLADQTATKGGGRVDVIDTDTNQLLYTIPQTKNEIGFAGAAVGKPGCAVRGPDGLVAIPHLHELYVGDGDSTVKVVDLDAKAVVAVIPTGGNCRADELAYDPLDHIIMIANDNDSPPFVTFISTDTQAVLGRYTYPATQIGFGLEQPVWNPRTKRFYLSVPAAMNNQGSIDVINPITMTVEKSLPTQCSPSGLVLTGNQHLITACGQVLDAITGNSLGVTAGAAGDEIWYNPGDNYTYFGFFNGAFGGSVFQGVAVVDATTNQLLTYIPASTHTLAVDSNNNRIFIPVTGSGIQVYAAQ